MSWPQLKNGENKTVEPDAKYNVETEGYNVKGCKFTSITDPRNICIMTFTNGKIGMFCFSKSKDAIRKGQ